MSDNMDIILEQLSQLNLPHDEGKIYLELLRGPSTHLRLSTITGISRTKVYRLVAELEKKNLVLQRTDERGTFLIAADPTILEQAIITQEQKSKQQRAIFSQLLPSLESLKAEDGHAFVVRTYEKTDGLKQMAWHELETREEMLSLGGQTIEDLIEDHRWAEKHRKLTVEAGYSVREILNHDIDLPTFTKNKEFMKRYQYRKLHSKKIYFNEQIMIYNDTVALYHWRDEQKVGVEIISQSYANMMRNIFEHYWKIAGGEK